MEKAEMKLVRRENQALDIEGKRISSDDSF